MKNRLSTLLLIAATLLVAGCNKDVNTITIKARIHDYNSDSKVYVDASNYSSWIIGDQVAINSTIATVSGLSNHNHTGTISLPEDQELAVTNYAVYPADAVTSTTGVTASGTTVHLPSMQKCVLDDDGHQVINALMASKGGKTMDFYNLCALLKVQLPATLNVTDIYVTTFLTEGEGENQQRVQSNQLLWGNGTITFNGNGERPTLSALSRSDNPANGLVDGGDTIYLHIIDRPTDGIYYITVPAVSNVNYEIRVNYKVTNNGQNYFYHVIRRQSGNSNNLSANQIGVVNFGSITIPQPENPDPNDFIPGIYSVSPTLKVNFAKGNLVFWPAATSGQWTFFTNQYETNGHTVTTHGNTPTGGSTEFPHMSAKDEDGTIVDDNGYGSATSFHDWGANYVGANWFTLSANEWTYLLNTRPVSYARYAKVQVNGVNGLLLFPDEFLWPNSNISQPSALNTASANFTQINYQIADFLELEEAGCVFLRANGYLTHTGNPRVEYSTQGFYWTNDFTAGQTQTTTYLHFDGSSVGTTGNVQEHEGVGMCVRLARIAE